jgi:predicted GIY-YIG superfamily endonuclease
MQRQYCYIIRIPNKNRTYVGYTVEPTRRIKQHNGILKGGAKATSISKDWQFLAIITSDSELFTKVLALSVEWHLKHPDGKSRSNYPKDNSGSNPQDKKRTDVKYRGVDGKLRSIIEVLNRYSFDFTVYVDDSQKAKLEELRNEAEAKKDLTNTVCNVINIKTLIDF